MTRKRKNVPSAPALDSSMMRLKVKNAYVSGPVELKYIMSKRKPLSDKRSNGRVLVIGGSKDYHGAPVLAAEAAYSALAALRSGAGYAKVAVPSSILNPVRSLSADIIAFANGRDSITFNSRIRQEIGNADAVVFGIGIGRGAAAGKAASDIIGTCSSLNKRTVIDADGIRVLSRHKGIGLGGNFAITPNQKEFELLAGSVPEEDELEDRVCAAGKAARDMHAVIVLKGHATIVTDGREATVNKAGSSALAVMGTGDVLSGMIAGLAANSRGMYEAAVAGVYMHSVIGDMLYKRVGAHILASDIVNNMPEFFRRFGRGLWD